MLSSEKRSVIQMSAELFSWILFWFWVCSQIVYFYYSQCVIGHVVYFLLSGLMTETFWQGVANGEWQLENNMQLGAFANIFKNIKSEEHCWSLGSLTSMNDNDSHLSHLVTDVFQSVCHLSRSIRSASKIIVYEWCVFQSIRALIYL